MPETDSPLLILARKLVSGPPSLEVLIGQLEGAEEYKEFVALVREFLPEREVEILRQPSPGEQIAAFADRFGDRYFPLHDSFKLNAEGYGDLLQGIPIIPLGVSCEDYHEILDDRVGLRLMTYLLAEPDGQEGTRVVLAEACTTALPTRLLERVPDGLSPAEAHELLEGTDYEALAHWADIIDSNTGNYFLDMDYEWLCQDGLPDWDRETVEKLVPEWAQADNIQDKVFKLAEWLEEDPAAHFGELLGFIEERRREEDDANDNRHGLRNTTEDP